MSLSNLRLEESKFAYNRYNLSKEPIFPLVPHVSDGKTLTRQSDNTIIAGYTNNVFFAFDTLNGSALNSQTPIRITIRQGNLQIVDGITMKIKVQNLTGGSITVADVAHWFNRVVISCDSGQVITANFYGDELYILSSLYDNDEWNNMCAL